MRKWRSRVVRWWRLQPLVDKRRNQTDHTVPQAMGVHEDPHQDLEAVCVGMRHRGGKEVFHQCNEDIRC